MTPSVCVPRSTRGGDATAHTIAPRAPGALERAARLAQQFQEIHGGSSGQAAAAAANGAIGLCAAIDAGRRRDGAHCLSPRAPGALERAARLAQQFKAVE